MSWTPSLNPTLRLPRLSSGSLLPECLSSQILQPVGPGIIGFGIEPMSTHSLLVQRALRMLVQRHTPFRILQRSVPAFGQLFSRGTSVGRDERAFVEGLVGSISLQLLSEIVGRSCGRPDLGVETALGFRQFGIHPELPSSFVHTVQEGLHFATVGNERS